MKIEQQAPSGEYAAGFRACDLRVSMHRLRSTISAPRYKQIWAAMLWLNREHGIERNNFGYLLALMMVRELMPVPLEDERGQARCRNTPHAGPCHAYDTLCEEIARVRSSFDQAEIEQRLARISSKSPIAEDNCQIG